MTQAKTTSSHDTAWGLVLWFIGALLGIVAVLISPIIVWPVAVDGLLNGLLPIDIQKWMVIFSLPVCFVLGFASWGIFAIGTEMIDDDPKSCNS